MRSPSAKHPALALTYSPEHIKFVCSVVMLKSPQRGEDKTKRFYAMSGMVLCHVSVDTYCHGSIYTSLRTTHAPMYFPSQFHLLERYNRRP